MTVGDRIRNRRKDLKLSADELAKMIGKDRATIYRYEKGDIETLPTSVLEVLAKALKVTPAHLMGWEHKLKNTTPYTPSTMIPIPVIGRVAAGITCLAETDIESYMLADVTNLNRDYDYVWLRVTGDSMEPFLVASTKTK